MLKNAQASLLTFTKEGTTSSLENFYPTLHSTP